jgi:hypothetical protein
MTATSRYVCGQPSGGVDDNVGIVLFGCHALVRRYSRGNIGNMSRRISVKPYRKDTLM